MTHRTKYFLHLLGGWLFICLTPVAILYFIPFAIIGASIPEGNLYSILAWIAILLTFLLPSVGWSFVKKAHKMEEMVDTHVQNDTP